MPSLIFLMVIIHHSRVCTLSVCKGHMEVNLPDSNIACVSFSTALTGGLDVIGMLDPGSRVFDACALGVRAWRESIGSKQPQGFCSLSLLATLLPHGLLLLHSNRYVSRPITKCGF